VLLTSNYSAPRYTPAEWFGEASVVAPTELSELGEAIVRVANSRRPDQKFTCHLMDRRDGSLPDLAASVAVFELLRSVRIVDDTAPASAGIRLCEVPDPVRKNRRVGDPWYVVEAFILVEQ
jgi:hypothetical protein